MTKYEIIKETSFTGTTLFSIEKNGKYVLGSANSSLDVVAKYVENLVKNQDQETIKEIIKTIEVHDTKNDN